MGKLCRQLGVQFLDRINLEVIHVLHALYRGLRTGNGGEGGDPGQQGRGANLPRVSNRIAPLFDRIDDQRDLVVFDHVHHMRSAFGDFVHRDDSQARGRSEFNLRTRQYSQRLQRETDSAPRVDDFCA